jgi:hypothetical protein
VKYSAFPVGLMDGVVEGTGWDSGQHACQLVEQKVGSNSDGNAENVGRLVKICSRCIRWKLGRGDITYA